MTTTDNQFDNEPIEQIPDPNKNYLCSRYWESTGWTYLMKLVMITKKYPQLIEQIERCKDIINQQNTDGMTALMLACCNSNRCSTQEMVQALIQAGADLNIKDNGGCTALMYACGYSNTDSKQETVQALIQAGADLNIKNNLGRTALMHTCSNSNKDSNQETVQALIQAGADLNIKSIFGNTALMFACRYSNKYSNQETVQALIQAGADLDYNKIIKIDSPTIYTTILDYHLHNQTIINQYYFHFTEQQQTYYDYYLKCKSNISYISEYYDEFYYQPNNIGALICQQKFEKSINRKQSNKLRFLFI